MRGYESVDRVLAHCEKLGNEIANVLKIWSGEKSGRGAADPSSADTDADAGIHLTSLADSATPPSYVDLSQDPVRTAALKDYIRNQPSTLSPDVQLKDYQLLGINWLNLLWGKGFSCILADDMGMYSLLLPLFTLTLLSRRFGKDNPSHRLLCVAEGTRDLRPSSHHRTFVNS
jgi:SWI/SNF-related matrix-associated actin-dependent regulator 1 of chromatin subfamily A